MSPLEELALEAMPIVTLVAGWFVGRRWRKKEIEDGRM